MIERREFGKPTARANIEPGRFGRLLIASRISGIEPKLAPSVVEKNRT